MQLCQLVLLRAEHLPSRLLLNKPQNTIINLTFGNGFFNSRLCTSEIVISIAALTGFDVFVRTFGDLLRFYLFALSKIIILVRLWEPFLNFLLAHAIGRPGK
jgi:hypothetical protein